MKGRRDAGADHPCRVGNLMCLDNPVAVLNQRQQTVVGQHEKLAQPRLGDDGLARRADAGIDDHHEHRVLGKVWR